MTIQILRILLLYGLIQFAFQACNTRTNKTTEAKKTTESDTTQTVFDTTIFVAHWEKMPKKLEGIDSINAWKFLWKNDILVNQFYDFRTCKEVEIRQEDLSNNGVADVFITFNKNKSFLYQKNKEGKWKQTWEGYEDGGGAPKLIRMFGAWMIKSTYFMACSNCSDDGSFYTKIYQDSVVDVFSLSWGYNYDHERTKSDYCIYEKGEGTIVLALDNQLIVKYDIALFELESKLVFLKDTTVEITYEWTGYRLLMKDVYPTALKAYVLKWHKKLEAEREEYGYNINLNREILLAYIDFKKEALLKLKNDKKYQATIKELELAYQISWKELIENWSLKYSFASPL